MRITKSLAKNWLAQHGLKFCFSIQVLISAHYKFGDINNNELLIVSQPAGWQV
jgi:hypothetical protein